MAGQKRTLWGSEVMNELCFMHVPKTAGSSCVIWLKRCFAPLEVVVREVNRQVYRPKGRNDLVLTVISHEERIPGYVTLAAHLKQSRNCCLVVAFVRNPFDRLVSAFYYLGRGGIRDQRDKRDAAKYVSPYAGDFHSFVRGTMNGGRPNVFEQIHLRPQIEWLVDEAGNLLVNFLGKFECLEADISKLAQVLCIPSGEMPLWNTTRHPPYRSLYDGVTGALIAEAYRQDFERFGYDPSEFSCPPEVPQWGSSQTLTNIRTADTGHSVSSGLWQGRSFSG